MSNWAKVINKIKNNINVEDIRTRMPDDLCYDGLDLSFIELNNNKLIYQTIVKLDDDWRSMARVIKLIVPLDKSYYDSGYNIEILTSW